MATPSSENRGVGVQIHGLTAQRRKSLVDIPRMGRSLKRLHDVGRGVYMEKNVPTKLVCEMVGGESYEYYPLGQYIVAAPGVCGGRPTFKYTRIDVHHALGLMAAGRTMEQVAHSYDLPVDAVQEALKLAARAFDRQGGRLVRRT